MKNQYFGDIRDLFKFDLIETILKDASLELRKFLYVIMLTKDRGKGGNNRNFKKAKEENRPGTGQDTNELYKILETQAGIKSESRNIAQTMRDYYVKKYKNCIFEAINTLLDKKNKSDYFNAIYFTYFETVVRSVAKEKHNLLIFLDPDTGLEPEASKGEEYVSFETVRYLYNCMADNSIIMIYQHGKQQHHNKLGVLKLITQHISSITDGEIVFYFLTKDKKTKYNLDNLLRQYKSHYSLWISTD